MIELQSSISLLFLSDLFPVFAVIDPGPDDLLNQILWIRPFDGLGVFDGTIGHDRGKKREGKEKGDIGTRGRDPIQMEQENGTKTFAGLNSIFLFGVENFSCFLISRGDGN